MATFQSLDELASTCRNLFSGDKLCSRISHPSIGLLGLDTTLPVQETLQTAARKAMQEALRKAEQEAVLPAVQN